MDVFMWRTRTQTRFYSLPALFHPRLNAGKKQVFQGHVGQI